MTIARTLTTTCRKCDGILGELWVGGSDGGRWRWTHTALADHAADPDMPDLADPSDLERWLATPDYAFPPLF